MDPGAYARALAARSLATGDATGWFERLYGSAARGEVEVPWERGAAHPLLTQWAAQQSFAGSQRAVIVGCGLGNDAEFVAALGLQTTAFDVAPTAIAEAQHRFPTSSVRYIVADLLDLPADWSQAFDLVVESMTVQALPRELRAEAIKHVGELVAPGGMLLAIAAADERSSAELDGPPWPLTADEINSFAGDDLIAASVEKIADIARSSQWWLATFQRPA